MGSIFTILSNDKQNDNHREIQNIKEEYMNSIINQNMIESINHITIPNLEDSRIYCLKKIINILTDKDIYHVKENVLFLYFYRNESISEEIILQYIQHSAEGTSFYKEIDNNWLLDFLYLFYFNETNMLDTFREESNKNKAKPYSNNRSITTVKYCIYINEMMSYMIGLKKCSFDEYIIFKNISLLLLPKSNIMKILSERYPLLFFKILKYKFENEKKQYEHIVLYFIESLWYTSSYQIFKYYIQNKH